MKSRTSSKFGQIRQPTAEIGALERLKKFAYAYHEKKRCLIFFSTVYDPIVMILEGNEDIH